MEFNKETPTGAVLIQANTFTVPKPFTEGHVCSAPEADVLNQTLAENIRNNMAARVKKAVDDGSYDQAGMQGEIDSYLEEYEFGVRRGRGPVDPIEREALAIAKEEVKRALRSKGYKLADIATDDINRLAEDAIAANPDITKEAKRRVEQRSKLGVGELNLAGAITSAIADSEAA